MHFPLDLELMLLYHRHTQYKVTATTASINITIEFLFYRLCKQLQEASTPKR